MSRGIIASPYIFDLDHDGGLLVTSISNDDVRYYALYWDKVVIPDSRHISRRFPDQDVLVQSGIIERPLPPLDWNLPGDFQAGMLEAQAKFAEQLINDDKNTDWVIHQLGAAFSIPPKYQIRSQTIRVELQRTLPVPVGDVPIAEILEFKDRRRDELSSLHQHLDETYLEILRSPDQRLEQHIQIERLKKAIADLDKVANERWKVTKKYDFSCDLSVDGAKILAGVAGAQAFNFYSQTGLSMPLAAIAGGLFSLVKVSAKKSVTFEPAKNNLKLSYLSHARKEAILPK